VGERARVLVRVPWHAPSSRPNSLQVRCLVEIGIGADKGNDRVALMGDGDESNRKASTGVGLRGEQVCDGSERKVGIARGHRLDSGRKASQRPVRNRRPMHELDLKPLLREQAALRRREGRELHPARYPWAPAHQTNTFHAGLSALKFHSVALTGHARLSQ